MLLGSLPMGRTLRLDDGRSVWLDEGAIEEWATSSGLLAPVLLDHDPNRLVGWVDKVTFRQHRAMLFGDLDPGRPDAKATARMVRAHTRDGLSPGVRVTRGEKLYAASGRYAPGNLIALPEISVTWDPRIPGARWLGC